MTDEDTARIAIKLKTMTEALDVIKMESDNTKDKGDVLGAGRRLERINIEATLALEACIDQ